LQAGEPTTLKLLLSDADTDAPVEGAKLTVELYGPKDVPPIRGEARAGSSPGLYAFDTRFPAAGAFAAVARAELAGGTDLFALDGLAVSPQGAGGDERRLPIWPFPVGLAVALLLLALLRRRGASAAACLLILAAGDARAHDVPAPAPASVLGADVFLAQEMQFALGLRTTPAVTETFPPPPGSTAAPRTFVGIPDSALVERADRELVFVRVGPEHFVAREPKLGWAADFAGVPHVAVIDGVLPGEKVVTMGAAFLRNGGAVAR